MTTAQGTTHEGQRADLQPGSAGLQEWREAARRACLGLYRSPAISYRLVWRKLLASVGLLQLAARPLLSSTEMLHGHANAGMARVCDIDSVPHGIAINKTTARWLNDSKDVASPEKECRIRVPMREWHLYAAIKTTHMSHASANAGLASICGVRNTCTRVRRGVGTSPTCCRACRRR